MTYGFYFCISLVLIVFQTTVMPYFSLFGNFYDLLIPFILYLSIFRPVRESVPIIIFLSFVMDNFSAGPFGLYGTVYCWLFIGTRWIITFLHLGNPYLLPFVAGMGVLIENLIFFGSFIFLKKNFQIPADLTRIVSNQILWAMTTGTLLLIFFNYIHKKWDKWLEDSFAEDS